MQHNIKLSDQLYNEAQRRAREAGFTTVDEFVASQLEFDFSDEAENFDDQFTPEFLTHLDQISEDMKAGKSVSTEEVDKHLADVRKAWLKNRAG
jgi:hypothetical protein